MIESICRNCRNCMIIICELKKINKCCLITERVYNVINCTHYKPIEEPNPSQSDTKTEDRLSKGAEPRNRHREGCTCARCNA